MFQDRGYKRTFYSAPQSVTSLVAAFLEPSLTVLVFLLVSAWFDVPIGRSDLTLCLLIFALTFPGRNRFWDRPLNTAVEIGTSWVSLLVILALCGYATRSLQLFEARVLLWWGLITPVLQWLAFFAGRRLLRSADDRVDPDAADHRPGNLRQVGPYIRERGVHEVYITLPLGSQPRIVALLEEVQDDGDVVPQATKDDPRITPLGAFRRCSSLDRGETDAIEEMQARVEYDLEYLRNWSLGLDLQIIARTIKLVFFDRHAY